MLGLIKEWLEVWMGHVLEWFLLQKKDSFEIVGKLGKSGCWEDLLEIGWLAEFMMVGLLRILCGGV